MAISVGIFRSCRYSGIIAILLCFCDGFGYGSEGYRSCGSSRTNDWQSDCENGEGGETTYDIYLNKNAMYNI